MTQTLYLNPGDQEDMKRAAEMLRSGKLVAFPTETVYGLGASALDENAIQSVYRVKKRPKSNPLIVHVATPRDASGLFDFDASAFSTLFKERFDRLSEHFWPGPLTLVGTKSKVISTSVTGGLAKVAVRVPSHPIALDLLRQAGVPIVAPSANLFTRPSPTSHEHVALNFDRHIAAIVDGGQCVFGIESTVIDIDAASPKILRHGVISCAQIAALLPDVLAKEVGSAKNDDEASPGLALRHYAPQLANVRLADRNELAKAWFGQSALLIRAQTQVLLERSLGRRPVGSGPVRALPDDAPGFARELFAAFYEMEALKPGTLLLEDLPALSLDSEWASVCDKLVRACAL